MKANMLGKNEEIMAVEGTVQEIAEFYHLVQKGTLKPPQEAKDFFQRKTVTKLTGTAPATKKKRKKYQKLDKKEVEVYVRYTTRNANYGKSGRTMKKIFFNRLVEDIHAINKHRSRPSISMTATRMRKKVLNTKGQTGDIQKPKGIWKDCLKCGKVGPVGQYCECGEFIAK